MARSVGCTPAVHRPSHGVPDARGIRALVADPATGRLGRGRARRSPPAGSAPTNPAYRPRRQVRRASCWPTTADGGAAWAPPAGVAGAAAALAAAAASHGGAGGNVAALDRRADRGQAGAGGRGPRRHERAAGRDLRPVRHPGPVREAPRAGRPRGRERPGITPLGRRGSGRIHRRPVRRHPGRRACRRLVRRFAARRLERIRHDRARPIARRYRHRPAGSLDPGRWAGAAPDPGGHAGTG